MERGETSHRIHLLRTHGAVLISFLLILFVTACGDGRSPTLGYLNIEHPAMPVLRDQTVSVGTLVTLNVTEMGAFSPNAYNYHWEVMSIPAKSKVTLSSQTVREPNFTPDIGGKYVFMLHVNHGKSVSAPAKVTITATSQKPIAKLVYRGDLVIDQTVELDASTSYNDKNRPLTYQWQIKQRPAGSYASLMHASEMVAHLKFDIAGIYEIQLIASDGFEVSEPNILVLHVYPAKTFNPGLPGVDSVTPIVEAGKDILMKGPGIVQLDGRQTMDPAHRGINILWAPMHQVSLDDPTSYRPNLDFKAQGAVIIKLMATNEFGLSSFDTVVVTTHRAGLYCADCHDGVNARSDSDHKQSREKIDCIFCHVTSSWKPFDIQFVPTHKDYVSRCNECHQKNATGIQAHRASSERCGACHSPQSWLPALKFEHTFTTMTYCQYCHDGTRGSGKPPTHVETTLGCSSCHDKTQWKPTRNDPHSVSNPSCLLCHNHKVSDTHEAMFAPQCDGCHTADRWLPVKIVNHLYVIGRCADCHDGKMASGKDKQHVPTTDVCEGCHSTNSWRFANVWDHTQQLGGACFDCHNGVVVQGKSNFHISTSNKCDACHLIASWKPYNKMDHAEVTVAGCTVCHDDHPVRNEKPLNHVSTTADCGVCHTTDAWKPALLVAP